MASLFPDDRPSGSRPPFRKFPSRPKAVSSEPSPLPEGWVLAHCDGGARGNPGPAGFGAVLVDAAGAPLAELSDFLGFRTNNFAEYSGLLAVLAWALENGHPRLRVISDSELMVKQIQGKYKVNSPDLKPLHEEARRRITRLTGFEILHALRHKNKTADRLANEAMDRGMGKAPGSTAATAPARAIPYPRAEPHPKAEPTAAPPAPVSEPSKPAVGTKGQGPGVTMLRGFVRDGVVHPLGGERLPENAFVKIILE